MGKDPGSSAEALLWIGAQTTEVEALLALVLAAPTLLAEKRALNELAEAAENLAYYARCAAGGDERWHRPRRVPPPRNARTRRRAVSAARGARFILSWTNRR